MYRIFSIAFVFLICLFATHAVSGAAPEVVIYASDVTAIHGNWTFVADASVAGGRYLSTPDAGWSSVDVPLTQPVNYFEVGFTAPAGTPYRVWLRLRALSNSKFNESVWLQYSDAVKNGSPVYAIGSASALLVNLENCAGCGPSGWGWKDGAYWLSQASTVQFSGGAHTLRIQVREDGVQIDQIVLSPVTYLSQAPGGVTNDATIVAKAAPPPPPPPAAATPYLGTAASIPGIVKAENFDNGGPGIAYADSTVGNSGNVYRATDVDLQPSSVGGYNVGWTTPGEWLTYGVNVTAAGPYVLQLRVASPGGANTVHVNFDRTSNGRWAISIPPTGGWQTWTTASVPVTLSAGVQQMTVTFDTGGINLNAITVTAASPPPGQPAVEVWVTSKDGSKRLAQQPAVTFVAGTGSSVLPTIAVDDSVRYQQIEGFGGSFTDSGAWMLSSISPDRQAAILKALFDRNAGIGLGFLRQPIGASDFARVAYTYNDISPTSTDYAQTNFSIEHDRAYILPALRAARAVNPTIRVLASPWTAPAWMKTSRTLSDGGNLKPDAFAAYAKYLVKFIQAYQAEGVPIDSLTVQNEPLTAPPYPSMVMTSGDQATFIGQHLGPALAAAGLKPRVFAWDHNWETTYPFAVLSNPAAAPYISGVAFHCYGGQPDAMSAFHQAYPQLDIVLSECADSSRATFGEKLMYDVRTTLIGSLRNWARSVAKWNLVLDENGGPKLYTGTCRNCTGLVTINSATGAVSYNEDYYALGHASRFIQRGAYRVDSTAFGSGGIENVAAANPDGSIAVLAVNSGGTQTFQIKSRGATLQYTLEAGSVATFKWTPR